MRIQPSIPSLHRSVCSKAFPISKIKLGLLLITPVWHLRRILFSVAMLLIALLLTSSIVLANGGWCSRKVTARHPLQT